MEYLSIAQEKDGQNGHEEQDPDFLHRLCRAHADALREVRQIFPVVVKKTLNARLRGRTPAMLLADAGYEFADLPRNLAAAGLLHQSGQSFRQAARFGG